MEQIFVARLVTPLGESLRNPDGPDRLKLCDASIHRADVLDSKILTESRTARMASALALRVPIQDSVQANGLVRYRA